MWERAFTRGRSDIRAHINHETANFGIFLCDILTPVGFARAREIHNKILYDGIYTAAVARRTEESNNDDGKKKKNNENNNNKRTEKKKIIKTLHADAPTTCLYGTRRHDARVIIL